MRRSLWIAIEALAEATAILATAAARIARAQLLEQATESPERWSGTRTSEMTVAEFDKQRNMARPARREDRP